LCHQAPKPLTDVDSCATSVLDLSRCSRGGDRGRPQPTGPAVRTPTLLASACSRDEHLEAGARPSSLSVDLETVSVPMPAGRRRTAAVTLFPRLGRVRRQDRRSQSPQIRTRRPFSRGGRRRPVPRHVHRYPSGSARRHVSLAPGEQQGGRGSSLVCAQLRSLALVLERHARRQTRASRCRRASGRGTGSGGAPAFSREQGGVDVRSASLRAPLRRPSREQSHAPCLARPAGHRRARARVAASEAGAGPRLPRVAGKSASRLTCPSRNQSRARARSDHGFESNASALPDYAWRSSVPTTADVAAPSRMEQSADQRRGRSQLVHSTSKRLSRRRWRS